MAKAYDISHWFYKNWIGTGGTREKQFVENPDDGKVFFFKESIDRYPSEFWSEVISSKVGQILGFHVLDYNVGIKGVTLGCLCESMIDQTSEELEHGVNLLKESVLGFKLSDRPKIGFNDVETSLNNYNGFIEKFIEILIFDAIIGNQDRHSENWAIIRSLDVDYLESNLKIGSQKMYRLYKLAKFELKNMPFKKFFMKYMNKAALVDTKFAPIYDSGSSLGRDIHESKIETYLSDKKLLDKYIQNGKSEIRWTSKEDKINHFEIIRKVKDKYPEKVTETIKKVMGLYDREKVKTIVNHIDENIPDFIQQTNLSLHRKQLIVEFFDFRIKKLEKL